MTADLTPADKKSGIRRWRPGRADVLFCALVLAAAAVFWARARDTMGAALETRLAAGRAPGLGDFIRTGLFYGILASLGVFAVLAFTRRLWASPLELGPVPVSPHLGRQVLLPLAAITLLAGWMRWDRLDTSLYADEAYTLQNYVMGKSDARKAWPPEFEAAGWTKTLFGNKEGNNHVLFSAAGRISLDIWRAGSGASPSDFNEIALRLPSFVTGTASVPLLALILAKAGLPRSGLVAAFLLSLHPWHIRYSGEARGYAMTIFFVLLSLLFLQLAARRGEWRFLGGYAFSQFSALASFPGAIYLLLPLTAGAVVWFAFDPLTPRPRRALTARLVAANLFAAAPFFILYGPSIPQITRYLSLDRARGSLSADWFANEWAYFCFGMPWKSDNPANPLLVAVTNTPGLPPWLPVIFAALLLPLLVIWGMGRLLAAGNAAPVLVFGSAISIVISVLHSAVSGALLYPWYLIHALPGFAAAAAAGIEGSGLLLARLFGRPMAARVWTGFFVLGFAFVTQRPRVIHMSFSREQNREAAVAARGGAQPGTAEAERVLAAAVWTDAPLYDRGLRWAPDPAALEPLIRQAISEQKPLYFVYRNRAGAEATVPELLKILDDRELFEFVRDLPGTDEQQFTHYVLRLRENLTLEKLASRLKALEIEVPADGSKEQ